MISAVIVTHNEEKKLATCLKNITGWANEIVVVDLESKDNSIEIAKKFGCKVVPHKFVPYVELVRNFAISQCSGNWILVLDPDEELPTTLKNLLKKYARYHKRGALNIPRKNIFFGKWINHTNFWPDRQIRFFSKGDVVWKEKIHSYPFTKIQKTYVPAIEKYSILHHGYSDFSDFIERQNRYSTIRAEEKYFAGHKFSHLSLFYNAIREFSARFIKHRGFLDGNRGLFLTLALILYHCSVEWKLLELQKQSTNKK